LLWGGASGPGPAAGGGDASVSSLAAAAPVVVLTPNAEPLDEPAHVAGAAAAAAAAAAPAPHAASRLPRGGGASAPAVAPADPRDASLDWPGSPRAERDAQSMVILSALFALALFQASPPAATPDAAAAAHFAALPPGTAGLRTAIACLAAALLAQAMLLMWRRFASWWVAIAIPGVVVSLPDEDAATGALAPDSSMASGSVTYGVLPAKHARSAAPRLNICAARVGTASRSCAPGGIRARLTAQIRLLKPPSRAT
jgi:hypothetical protein